MQDRPLVGIVMGSISDRDVMEECIKTLKEMDIDFEVTVSSAHRTPDKTRDYATSATAQNAAIFAAQILALKHADIARRLEEYKEGLMRVKGVEED